MAEGKAHGGPRAEAGRVAVFFHEGMLLHDTGSGMFELEASPLLEARWHLGLLISIRTCIYALRCIILPMKDIDLQKCFAVTCIYNIRTDYEICYILVYTDKRILL